MRIRGSILLLSLAFCVSTVSSQGEGESQAPPPPKPKPTVPVPERVTSIISTGPVTVGGKFHSPASGFRIAFPGKPKTEVSSVNGAFGPTKYSSYSLDTSLGSYVVGVVDFPVAIKDKLDLNMRFDAMRDGEVSRMKGRVTTDSEFFFGSNYGRSVVVEGDTVSSSNRFIVVEQRMFILSVYTKGNLSRQSNTLRNANLKRVNDFLNSFEVTSIPAPLLTAVELPEDLGVSVVDGTVFCSFFSVSIQAPAGWHFLEKEESEIVMEIGKESIAEKRPELGEFISDERQRLLFAASKKPISSETNSAMFMMVAENAPFPNFRPLNVAQTFTKMFLDKTDVVTKKPSETNIGEFEFAWLETRDSVTKVRQRLYWANVKGASLHFVLTFVDEMELQEMLRALNSLKRIEKVEN